MKPIQILTENELDQFLGDFRRPSQQQVLEEITHSAMQSHEQRISSSPHEVYPKVFIQSEISHDY